MQALSAQFCERTLRHHVLARSIFISIILSSISSIFTLVYTYIHICFCLFWWWALSAAFRCASLRCFEAQGQCSRRVVVACGQVALAGLWAGWSSHSRTQLLSAGPGGVGWHFCLLDRSHTVPRKSSLAPHRRNGILPRLAYLSARAPPE